MGNIVLLYSNCKVSEEACGLLPFRHSMLLLLSTFPLSCYYLQRSYPVLQHEYTSKIENPRPTLLAKRSNYCAFPLFNPLINNSLIYGIIDPLINYYSFLLSFTVFMFYGTEEE